MKRLLLTSLCLLFTTTAALGDWDPGDPHKMHQPQLPDPFGWDVYATDPKVLADDWQCTESGPVSDIHLWGSWKEGIEGEIPEIYVSIHDNIPAGVDPLMPWSHPGDLLWDRYFDATEFTVRDYGTGIQGWYNPNTSEYFLDDHFIFHQINIVDIFDPFIQFENRIYWLDISVKVVDPLTEWGWKTSMDHFADAAVWSDMLMPEALWGPLNDPIMGEPLDLAFVITPEPATIALLGLGGLALLRRRKA